MGDDFQVGKSGLPPPRVWGDSVLIALTAILAVACLSSCTHLRSEVKNTAPSPTPSPSTPQVATRLPAPTGFVDDYANVIDDDSQTRLVSLLTKLKAASNIEFAIVTVDTTKGEPIFDYSLGVAKEWGIGPKDLDGGGLLLLFAIKDRQWHLQVSRSLEKDLPNEVCKELGDQSVPLYKKGDYAGGIEKYATALITRLKKQRNFTME